MKGVYWGNGILQQALGGILGCVGAIANIMTPAFAQVMADPSLGTRVNQNDLIYQITGGTTVGGTNLFHSFSRFDVPDGGVADFLNTNPIVNIFSRVTGGTPSDIQGLIRAQGSANLFLMNPAGIVFGRNAQLDVGGSFVATTANAIRFSENGFFSASSLQTPSQLLTIQPSALLFNQINQATTITNQSQAPAGLNPAGQNVTGLRVPNGRTLLLVGGNINIDGGGLRAYNGNVELASLAAPGKVGLNFAANTANNLSLVIPDSVERADISLRNGAEINVRGTDSGSIKMSARNVNLTEGSILRAGIDRGLGTLNSKAGDIIINATGTTTLADRSFIANVVQPRAFGNAGDINITTGSLIFRDGSLLNVSTFGQGDGGSVFAQADDSISLSNSSYIVSNVESGGVGNGGNVDITSGSLSLINGSQIQTIIRGASTTAPAGRGKAGNANINVRDDFTLSGVGNNFPSGIFGIIGSQAEGNGGNIDIKAGSIFLNDRATIQASTFGKGNGGNVIVNARTISFDGTQNNFSSGIFSNVGQGGIGNAGDINITTDSLSITNAAQIAAATFGKGNGGNVMVNARTISFDGRQNNFGSGIVSNVEKGGIGNAGDINITTDSLSITNAAQIAAATFGKGNGGNVMVNARTISFDGRQNNFGSGIFSNVEKEGVGKAGDINITTDSLSITNAAQIAAATFGQGNGGNVMVKARTISLDGRQNNFGSGIVTNAESTSGGNPGDIDITTRLLSINNAAGISAANRTSSESTEQVGNININSATVSLDNQGSLSAESASGNGGNINLQIRDLLLLRGGSEISTNAGTDQKGGDGGNIDINSKFIIAIPQENSDITANAFRGRGGNVQIISQGIFGIEPRPQQTDKSDITASSDLGIAGNINVLTPDNSAIQNSLTELQQNPIDTNALIANSCIARSSKVEGTFMIIGSGGLPNRPGDAFVSPYPTGTVQGVIPDTSSWKKGDPIIEATGVYRLANGQLVMSRECL